MSVGIPNESILKACQDEHLKKVLGHHPPRVSQGNHLDKSASFSSPKMSMVFLYIDYQQYHHHHHHHLGRQEVLSNCLQYWRLCFINKYKLQSSGPSTWYVPMCWLWPQHRLLHLKDCIHTLLRGGMYWERHSPSKGPRDLPRFDSCRSCYNI